MNWQIQWTSRGRKDLEKLDPTVRKRVIEGLERFAEVGDGDVRRLHGKKKGLFRLRAGEWRVVFAAGDHRTIVVLSVHPRGGAYKP